MLQAANYIGIAADLTQLALEYYGYTMQGKVIGAVGNTISGGLAGFALGGPPGALVGGALGLGLWIYSERELRHNLNKAIQV